MAERALGRPGQVTPSLWKGLAAVEGLGNRDYGTDTHDLGRHAGAGEADETRLWLETHPEQSSPDMIHFTRWG